MSCLHFLVLRDELRCLTTCRCGRVYQTDAQAALRPAEYYVRKEKKDDPNPDVGICYDASHAR